MNAYETLVVTGMAIILAVLFTFPFYDVDQGDVTLQDTTEYSQPACVKMFEGA